MGQPPPRPLASRCRDDHRRSVAVATALPLAACSSPAPGRARRPLRRTGSRRAPRPPPPRRRRRRAPTTPALPGLPRAPCWRSRSTTRPGPVRGSGIERAEVVYVEPVEGGLTRLLAVFSTGAGDLPPEVGPIRSARETDVALLANWGRVALAYSGGSAFTRSVVDQANLAAIPYDAATQGYRRAGDRRAPYNVIGNTQALLARAGTGADHRRPRVPVRARRDRRSPAASVTDRVAGLHGSPSPGTPRAAGTSSPPTAGPTSPPAGRGSAPPPWSLQEVPARLSENRDVNGAQTPVVDLVGPRPGDRAPRRPGLARRVVPAGPRLADRLHGRGRTASPSPWRPGRCGCCWCPAGQAVTVG